MKFVDELKLELKAGNGGKGMVSFRRETFIPLGGPSGGDGGKGGDIVFLADEGLYSLLDLTNAKIFRAKDGESGQSKGCHGAAGEDLILKVPPGTIVFDADTGEKIAELLKHKDEAVICHGGRGGRGNMRFATSINQAPKYAEPGGEGEVKNVTLELKLMANVGLIGMPNAGKSTLISRISRARPKIADYPFTTLSPVLGIVPYGYQSFVVADIPGLIEGASSGKGLGIQFLRHIERCKVLVHLLDMSEVLSAEEALYNFDSINYELQQFGDGLLKKPTLVALSKIDAAVDDEIVKEVEAILVDRGLDVIKISAVSGVGLKEFNEKMVKYVFGEGQNEYRATP